MSNVKRKDSKNRNLRNGESQRKDGRYVYKYTDIYGKPQFIYSWKLVPTDKTPAGKRDDISLREKEAQIKKDLNDSIGTCERSFYVGDINEADIKGEFKHGILKLTIPKEQPKKEHQEGYRKGTTVSYERSEK